MPGTANLYLPLLGSCPPRHSIHLLSMFRHMQTSSILHIWSGENERRSGKNQGTLFSKLAGNPVKRLLLICIKDQTCFYQSSAAGMRIEESCRERCS